MVVNLFTIEQQEILRANPYTLSVNDRQIRYTVEFKRYLLNETAKPGVTDKQAFIKAGYDPEILGQYRIRSTVKSVREEAASPRGLHETGPSKDKLAKEDLSKKNTEKAIKELQDEVVKLQQQVEFLKKILQMRQTED